MNYKVTGTFELEIEDAENAEVAQRLALEQLAECIRDYPEQVATEISIKTEEIE